MSSSSKVLSVDVDGVCYDFSLAYSRWLLDNDRQSFTPGKTSEYSLRELLGITREQFLDDINNVLCDTKEMSPLPGCKETMDMLVAGGHVLYLVTARLPAYRGATQAWVNHWALPVEDIICVGTSAHSSLDPNYTPPETKLEVCLRLGAFAHIDDHPTHLRTMADTPVTPVAFGDYPWTETSPWNHASTWEDVPNVLPRQ